MATFTWYGQVIGGGTETIGDGTEKLSFYGSAFNDPIQITTGYNDSTHVENYSNVDQCDPHIYNTKYIDSTHVNDGSTLLQSLSTASMPLKINFAHGSSVITEDAEFWAYDGTTESTGPTDVTFYCYEGNNAAHTTWINAEGSGSAAALEDNTTSTSHDFFIAISVQPDTVGAKTAFTLKIQLTYS